MVIHTPKRNISRRHSSISTKTTSSSKSSLTGKAVNPSATFVPAARPVTRATAERLRRETITRAAKRANGIATRAAQRAEAVAATTDEDDEDDEEDDDNGGDDEDDDKGTASDADTSTDDDDDAGDNANVPTTTQSTTSNTSATRNRRANHNPKPHWKPGRFRDDPPGTLYCCIAPGCDRYRVKPDDLQRHARANHPDTFYTLVDSNGRYRYDLIVRRTAAEMKEWRAAGGNPNDPMV